MIVMVPGTRAPEVKGAIMKVDKNRTGHKGLKGGMMLKVN